VGGPPTTSEGSFGGVGGLGIKKHKKGGARAVGGGGGGKKTRTHIHTHARTHERELKDLSWIELLPIGVQVLPLIGF